MTASSYTDADWAPLRRVLPSFRNYWKYCTSDLYDPTSAFSGLGELARYVGAVLFTRENPAKLRPLFRALEALLRTRPDLTGLVSIGFFEDLISLSYDYRAPF